MIMMNMHNMHLPRLFLFFVLVITPLVRELTQPELSSIRMVYDSATNECNQMPNVRAKHDMWARKTQPETGGGGVVVEPHQAAASHHASHAATQPIYPESPYESFDATPGEEVTYLVPVWPKKESVEKLLRTIANRYKAAASTVIGMVGRGANYFKSGGGGGDYDSSYDYSPEPVAAQPVAAPYVEENDIFTSYDPVVDHRGAIQCET